MAIPNHAFGTVAAKALLEIQHCPLVDSNMPYQEFTTSVLTLGHNLSWSWGINEFLRGNITHLLIMHSDIRPMAPHWMEVLVTELWRSGADVLGCFIPVKNQLGLTSTALDTDPWRPQRLSLFQAKQLPVTWTHPALLLNTGLLLIDLHFFATREPIRFHIEDEVRRDEKGFLMPFHKPEDWNFSRDAKALGASLYVTRGIGIHHCGITTYPNAPAWGVDYDRDCVLGGTITVSSPHEEDVVMDLTENQAGEAA